MKNLFLAIALITMTSTASAFQVIGCFERIYTPTHLRANPAQLVKSMKLAIIENEASFYHSISVQTRRAYSGVRAFANTGGCNIMNGDIINLTLGCTFATTEEGTFTLAIKDPKYALLITPAGMVLNETSEQATADEARKLVLAAGSDNGVYALFKVDPARCL